MNLVGRLLVIGLVLAGGPALAQDFDCRAVMQAFRAEPVPGLAPPTSEPCEAGQLRAFLRNEAAIARAEPVADLSELHGTWLGDDAWRYLSRVSVPGTEMLVIGPGATDGSISITQYWLKPDLPDSTLLPWDDQGYAGWVARGALIELSDGRFRPGAFGDEAITYSGLRLEHERAYELHVLSELNHFELPLTLRRSADVLVLDSERLHPLSRDLSPHVTTYTRVDRDAVEMALLLVVALEQSFGQSFDCFAHQLHEGSGPLIDAFAPYGIADARAWLDRLHSETRTRMALMEALSSDMPPEDGAEQMAAAMESYVAFLGTTANQHFVTRLSEAGSLGCPDVY